MATAGGEFLIRGDRLKKFVLALLVLDKLDDSKRLKGKDGRVIATLVNERRRWQDKSLGGVFPLPMVMQKTLAEFYRFFYLNAAKINSDWWDAAGILNMITHPTTDEIESGGQRVTNAEPLVNLFKRFQSGKISW